MPDIQQWAKQIEESIAGLDIYYEPAPSEALQCDNDECGAYYHGYRYDVGEQCLECNEGILRDKIDIVSRSVRECIAYELERMMEERA